MERGFNGYSARLPDGQGLKRIPIKFWINFRIGNKLLYIMAKSIQPSYF